MRSTTKSFGTLLALVISDTFMDHFHVSLKVIWITYNLSTKVTWKSQGSIWIRMKDFHMLVELAWRAPWFITSLTLIGLFFFMHTPYVNFKLSCLAKPFPTNITIVVLDGAVDFFVPTQISLSGKCFPTSLTRKFANGDMNSPDMIRKIFTFWRRIVAFLTFVQYWLFVHLKKNDTLVLDNYNKKR